MNELTYWFEVPELARGPFLAINLSNRKPGSRKHNDTLLPQNKTGNWDIPNEARSGGIEGKTVVLFYTGKGQSEIYTGKVKAETPAGTTKSGRTRYQLAVTKAWKTAGVTTATFSEFFSGFKLNSNPTCIWINGSTYSPLVNDNDPNADPNDDFENGKGGSNYMAWVAQRVGHAIFAKRVRKVWGTECALTKLHAPRLVQACHLVPWSEANKTEKISADNGLMLCVHLHALLDSHLLSFDDDGTIMLAEGLPEPVKELVLSSGQTCLWLPPSNKQIHFLERHRQNAKHRGQKLVRVTA